MHLSDGNDFVGVPVSIELYQSLLARHGNATNAVVEYIVSDFLDRTADDFVVGQHGTTEGITWDPLFLPSGSRLRTKYKGEYVYAEVQGDRVIANGQSFTSVAQATNSMRGGTSNNAWQVLEVCRPGDPRWFPAERLRMRG